MARKLTEDQFDTSMNSLAAALGNVEYDPMTGNWRRKLPTTATEAAMKGAGAPSPQDMMKALQDGIERAQKDVVAAVETTGVEAISDLENRVAGLEEVMSLVLEHFGLDVKEIPAETVLEKTKTAAVSTNRSNAARKREAAKRSEEAASEQN